MTARVRLPRTREGIVCKLEVFAPTGIQEGYIIANTDDDGNLREVFLEGFAKEGSTFSGWVSLTAVLLSVSLQSGVELATIARKLSSMRFEPHGPTSHPVIMTCDSVPDFIARWLVLRFGDESLKTEFGF